MSTSTIFNGRSSAPQLAQDFVSSDTAALASHMSHCASSRSRFFNLHAVAESARSFFFSRMVTAAVLATVLVGAIALV